MVFSELLSKVSDFDSFPWWDATLDTSKKNGPTTEQKANSDKDFVLLHSSEIKFNQPTYLELVGFESCWNTLIYMLIILN